MHTDLRRTGWFECSDDKVNAPARGGGLELPRQRLRHPHRLPDARARGVDGRLAAVRADRGLPVRRGRLLRQVAPGPRRRAVGRRHRRQHGPMPPAEMVGMLEHVERLGRLGRRRGDRAVGDLPGVRRPPDPRGAVADDGALARASSSGRRASSGTRRGWRARPDAGAARAVPLGHRLPLGRVARARTRTVSDFGAFIAADKGDVATAFFARSTEVAAQIAQLLGRDDEADALRGC